jgi:hypothetical protein
MTRARNRRTANEELFALVLKRWQSLPSEREKASFFVDVVLRDERFTDLLPFMVEAALKELDRREPGASGAARSKLSATKERSIRETFSAAADEWKKGHPGASGLSDAQRAWRYAVGRAAAKTHADPKTVKRRFPDPVEKARARVRAHVQALREGTPKK